MDALSNRLPLSLAPISLTDQELILAKIPELFPLVDLTPSGEIQWNFDQSPDLLSEENFDLDLLKSLQNSIRKRTDSRYTTIKNLQENCNKTRELLKKKEFDSASLTLIIDTLEEILLRDEINFLDIAALADCDFEIHSDRQAYVNFMLYCLSSVKHISKLPQKLFLAIKSFKQKTCGDFSQKNFIKKLSLMLLTKSLPPETVIELITKELHKTDPFSQPIHTQTLLRIKKFLSDWKNNVDVRSAALNQLNTLIKNKNLEDIPQEFQRYLDTKPLVSNCASDLDFLVQSLKTEEDGEALALKLCELALKIHPVSDSILRVKRLLGQSKETKKSDKVATINLKVEGGANRVLPGSPLDAILKMPEVKVVYDSKQDKEISIQAKLSPLIKESSLGYSFDVEQNDWLLDKDTFAYRLNEVFLENLHRKYPDFQVSTQPRPKFSPENLKVTIRKNGILDISDTYLAAIIPNKKGWVESVTFFDHLFMNGFLPEIDYYLTSLVKSIGKSQFTDEQRTYLLLYVRSLRYMVDGDEVALMKVFKDLEAVSQQFFPTTYPFLEKLKILLIYRGARHFKTTNMDWSATLQMTDVLTQKAKVYGCKNSSLDLLKAEILILAGRYKECRIQLNSLPPEAKEKRSYFKTLCSLAFHEGAWAQAQDAGEHYFKMHSGDLLEVEDLETAFNLSTIYKYNQTIGDEKLFLRFIKTLHTSQKTFYPSEFVHLFYNIAFNCYFNPAAIKFKDHKISFIENEHPLMKSCKETLVYMIAKTSSDKSTVREAIGISQQLFDEITSNTAIETRADAELIADVILTKALVLSRNNRIDHALLLLNKIEHLAPYHLEALCVKAQILMIQNKDREALDIITNCIQRTSRFYPDWVVLRMHALIKLGASELAFVNIQEALAKEPGNVSLQVGEVYALNAMDRSGKFEKAKSVLQKEINRNDRLGILRLMIANNLRAYKNYLQDQLTRLIDHSGDAIETEAYYTKCLLFLLDDNILEATKVLSAYGQKDSIGLYMEIGIEITRKNYRQALEILKNCQKLRSAANKETNFLISDVDIKNYEFEIYANLGRYQDILDGRLNWVPKGIPDLSLIAYLDKIVTACRKLKQLGIGLKVCEKLLRVYPKNDFVKHAKEILTREIEELSKLKEIEATENNNEASASLNDNHNTSSKAQDVPEALVEATTKNDLFFFSKKPNLIVKQIKATIKEGPENILPIHPALKKMLEAEIVQAKKAVAEMFQSDDSQIELGKSYKTIFGEQYGPLAEYEKIEKEDVLTEKPTPQLSKEHPKPAAKPAAKAPSASPHPIAEIPKRMTKSVEVASRELGLEVPVKFNPLPYATRFSGASLAVTELTKNLELLLKPNTLHPIYKNEEFASRYLNIQLFRMAELLKPTTKGETSQEGFRFYVQQIFRECRDVVQLRNFITLYGHRTSFKDLIQFCQYMVKSGISENLLCVSDGKKPVRPPLEIDLRRLFPLVFQQEWMQLSPVEQKKALLEMIDFELEFVAKLIDVAKPDLFEKKGEDVCEVLKLSVLRIGKALSYIKIKLKISIFDKELIALINASKEVRHQITKPHVIGLPRELQPKWLSAFMMGSVQLRDRIKSYFNKI